jgi:hypothetical protein
MVADFHAKIGKYIVCEKQTAAGTRTALDLYRSCRV